MRIHRVGTFTAGEHPMDALFFALKPFSCVDNIQRYVSIDVIKKTHS